MAGKFVAALAAIQADERYRRNLDWGQPRPGHPEGTVRAHIAELERNLAQLEPRLTDDQSARLRVIIHTHDTFKAEAQRGVAISDPRSHASIARCFTAEFCDDPDVLATIQWHDEPYALWRKHAATGTLDSKRLAGQLANIRDWDLFLAFEIIDGCTAGKSREPLLWFFETISGRVASRFTAADVFPE